jgi:adenine-specific DNA-methyltransferase
MSKDYSKLEKGDLLKVIDKLESRKKYGLIWDEEKTKEKFERESENALPVLKEIKSKEIKTDPAKPTNILIEGDNYHALSVLNYTHQGKIDVIYIDPPYNTGSKDWKYNNDYVDSTDTYKHSKWLSFMSKRLRVAKNLLKETGILICTIDENEHATLGMLLPEIFPNKEIVCITIIHNPGGIQGKNFSYCHEYAYFVYPSNGRYINLQERDENPDIRPLRNVSKGDHLREDAANCFYPIFVKNGKIVGFGDVSPDSFHPKAANIVRKDGVMEIYPIDTQGNERKWVFARQSVEKIFDELTVEFNKKRKIWDVIRKKTQFPYKTVWLDPKYNANIYGTQLVNRFVDTKFPFPKSLYAVRDCIKACIHPKNGIILDFFAGSGTTGHAVSILNKEDGGSRQYILCTNNEGGIAQEVCYPRIKKVIKGHDDYPDITNIPSNLKYFKTAFVRNSISQDDLKLRITRECTEMLCLREGIFEEAKKKADYRIFEQNGRVMAVYYALERDGIAELKLDLDKISGDKILYCFTLDPLGLDKEDFAGWDNVSLEPIPQKILDIYEQIYEY